MLTPQAIKGLLQPKETDDVHIYGKLIHYDTEDKNKIFQVANTLLEYGYDLSGGINHQRDVANVLHYYATFVAPK